MSSTSWLRGTLVASRLGAQVTVSTEVPVRWACLVVLAALASGCEEEPEVVRGDIDKVARACTDVVYAREPFGSHIPVDRFSLDFVVPEGAQGFVLSAHNEGASTTLSSLEAPSGRSYDLLLGELEEFRPSARANLYGLPVDVDRIMVPPTPNHRAMLETGRWEARGDTTGGKFCLSLAVSSGAGEELQLTVYLAGVDGLTADNAARDPDLAAVFDEVGQIFDEVGIRVAREDIEYVELGLEDSIRFQLLADDEFQDLLRTSSARSRSSDDALRLNVFLIRGFSGILGGWGVLGIASGVPGAAGVHGTSDSGVVFGVEDFLGVEFEGTEFYPAFSGNAFLGKVMAHEIGHFLGLFHTTEIRGGNDPLDDTPACSPTIVQHPEQVFDCPDAENLMFPTALPGTANELTALQVETTLINPLLRGGDGERL